MDEKDGSTPINKATYAEEQEIKRVTDDYGRGKSPIQEYEDIYSTPEYQKDLIERHDQKLQEPVENPAQEPKDVQPVQEEAQPVAEPEKEEPQVEVQDQTDDETSDDVEETVTEETDQNEEVEEGSAEEPGKEGPEQEQEAEEAPQEPDPEDQMRRAREEARRRYSEELRNMRMQDAVALGIGAIGTGIASIGDSIGAVEHLFDAIMSGNPVSVASTMLADTLANNTRRENHINALFADYRVLRGADEAVLATTVRGNMLLSRKREVMRGDALATIEVGDWLRNRKGPDGKPLDVANMSAQDIADFNAFCRQRVTAITNMIHDPKAKLSPQDRRAWEATLRRYGWIISDVGARAGELRSQAEAGVESATQAYDDAKEATSLAGDALHAAQAQHKASATGATASGAATGRKGKGPRTVNTSTTTTVVPPAQAGGTGPAPAPQNTAVDPNQVVDPNQAVSDPDQDVDPDQAGNVTPPEDTPTDTEGAVDPQAQQVVDPDPQENVQEPPQPVPPPAYTDVVWSMESKWGANRGDYGVAYADQARTNRKNFASRIKTLEGNLARTAPGTPENIYLTNEIALRRGFNNMLILGNKFKGSPIYKVLSDVERKRVLDNLERSFSDFSKTMFDGNGYLRADAIMPDWIDPLNDIQYLSGKEAPNMFIEINNLRNSPVASDPNQSANMDELSTLSNDILDNPSKYSTPEGQAEFRTKFDAIKGRFTVASPTTPETEAEAETETETEEAPIDDYVKGLLTSDPDNFLNRVHQDATTGNDAAARTLRYLNDAKLADFDESTQTWQFLNGAGVDDLKRAFGVSEPAEKYTDTTRKWSKESTASRGSLYAPNEELLDNGSEKGIEQYEGYLKQIVQEMDKYPRYSTEWNYLFNNFMLGKGALQTVRIANRIEEGAGNFDRIRVDLRKAMIAKLRVRWSSIADSRYLDQTDSDDDGYVTLVRGDVPRTSTTWTETVEGYKKLRDDPKAGEIIDGLMEIYRGSTMDDAAHSEIYTKMLDFLSRPHRYLLDNKDSKENYPELMDFISSAKQKYGKDRPYPLDKSVDEYLKNLAPTLDEAAFNRMASEAKAGNQTAEEALKYLNFKGVLIPWNSGKVSMVPGWEEKLRTLYPIENEEPVEEKGQDSEQLVENDAIEEPATEETPGSEVNDGDREPEGEGQSAIKEALDQYYEENSKDDYEPFDVYKMFPDHTDVLNNIFNAYSENQLEGLLFPPGEDVELGELEDTLKDYHILAERDYVENGKERKGLYIHPEWKKGRQLLRAGERPDIHIPDVEEFKEKTRRVSPIGVSRYIQDLLRSKDYLDPEQTEKLEFLFSALEDRGIVPKGTFDDPELFKNVDKGAYNGLFTDGEKPQEFSDQFVYDEDSTYDELKSAAKQLSEASKMGKGEVEAAEDLIDPALNALISTRTQTSKGKPISGMYGAFQLARALSVLHNSNNMEPEFRIEGGHYKELSEYDRNSVEKLLRAMRVRVERAKEAVKAENDGQFPPDALAQIRDRVKQEIVGKDPKKYHELFINPDREADLTDAKTVRDIGLTGPFNLGGKTMGISALRNIIDADKPDKPYEGDRDALDRARIHAANALLEGVGRSVITDPYFTGLRLLDGLEGGRWENHPVVTDLRKKLNDTMDSQEPQSLRDIKENFMGHDTDLINMISRVDRKSGNNPRFELRIMPDGDPYIWDNVLGSRILDRNRKFYRDPHVLGTMLDHIMDEDFVGSQQLKAYYMNNPELFHNLNAALDALYDDDEVRSLLGDMSDVDENDMLEYMFVAEADSPSPSVQLVLNEAIHNYLDGGMPWDVLKGYSAEDLVELAKNGMMVIDEARKQVGESMRKSVSLFARAMIEEPDHEVTRFVLGMMGASPMDNIEMFMKSVKPSEIGDPVFARITGTYRSLLGL